MSDQDKQLKNYEEGVQTPKRTTVLHNPISNGADVLNYPISVAELDPETGKPITDTGNGQYKSTGQTLLWSIKKGERLVFPEYVADVLKDRYGFLVKEEGKKLGKVDESVGTILESPYVNN